jgi:predicted phage terminase large subunit-like protein
MMAMGENKFVENPDKKPAPPFLSTKTIKERKLLQRRQAELKDQLKSIQKRKELEEVREKGLEDFYFFCKNVMGFKDLYEPLHRPLCEFIANPDSKRKMILIPRGHFKTTIGSISYPIWKLLRNREERIGLMSVTSDLAEDHLRELIMKIDDTRTQALYSHELPPSFTWPLRRGFEYRCPRRGSKVGPSLYACGVESSETGRHFSTIIIDDMVNDQNTRNRAQLERIWDWFGRQGSVLDSDGEFLVIGCLTGDSKVLMGDGVWKEIKDIKAGEEVWTQNEGKAEKKLVEGMWPQGKAEIAEVNTTTASIRATLDHPFLVLRGKTEWFEKPEYVKVRDLKKGDKIITAFSFEGECDKQTIGERLSERQYTRESVTASDMWLFGFILGDGWVVKSKKRHHGFSISQGEDSSLNDKVITKASEWCKVEPRYIEDCRYYRFECAQAARELESLGLSGSAQTKRIPEWVYRQPIKHKKAFLKGLLDADGTKLSTGNGYRIELANRDLINDVYFLAITSGVRPTSICYRERLCQPPCSPFPVTSTTWSLGLNFLRRKAYHDFAWERVVSIDKSGDKEDVYDLSIEGNHNYIANGIVSHNTRWHWGDPYGRLQEKKDWEKMILSATTKSGSLIFPTVFSKKFLEEKRRDQGDYRYSCFYENNPSGAGLNPFDIKRFSWVDYRERHPDAYRYLLIDPATTTNEWSHPTGIVIGDALAKEKTFVVTECIREKLEPDSLVNRIIGLCKKHDPYEIVIEADSAHKIFVSWLKREFAKKKLSYHIHSMKNPVKIGRETRTINTLQPRVHNGEVVFADNMIGREMLLEEFQSFPRGKSDDLVMALSAVLVVTYPRGYEKPKRKRIDRRTAIFNNIIARNGTANRKKRPVPRTRLRLY